MKKLNLKLLLAVSLLVIPGLTRNLYKSPNPVYAATIASPSAKITIAKVATPSASPTVTSIEDKIKNLVKENLSATESDLNEKINQKTLVGYVGTIKSISTENISLDSQGNLIQITTTSKTTIVKSGNVIKPSSLALSDKIIVIGIMIKNDIIQAKRILVVGSEESPVITGTLVANISSLDIKKKIIGLTVGNTEVLYSLSKKSTIKIANLEVGQTVFAITKLFNDKNFLSRAKIL